MGAATDAVSTAIHKLFATANSITLAQAVDGFIAQDLAGKAPLTERWYRQNLAVLVTDLGIRDLAEIQPVDVLAWGAIQLRSGKSPYTISGRIQAARRLFHWLHGMDITPVDLGKLLKRPRLPKGQRSGIDDKDLQTILDAAKGNPRDTALLLFLESTGCRRDGAAGLRVDDIDLERRRASVTEKGSKTRTVIFSEEAGAALAAWLEVRGVSDERVFGLAAVGVSGVLRRYQERLGIRRPVSPHQWRHRFARRALLDGMGLEVVSDLLGHESILVTKVFYGGFNLDQLQDQYDKIRARREKS